MTNTRPCTSCGADADIDAACPRCGTTAQARYEARKRAKTAAIRAIRGIASDADIPSHDHRWSRHIDPINIERDLMKLLPRDAWSMTPHYLIFHGRRICQARRPLCGQCPVFALCRWPSRQAFAMGQPPIAEIS